MKKKWIPIEVAGEFPHHAGVTQVLDEKAFDAILSQPIPEEGILFDFDHYSSLTEDERNKLDEMGIQLPSNAAGWIKKFAKRVKDGVEKIFGLVELTPDGEKAIDGREYIFTSPVHPRDKLEDLGDGKVRPLAISKVALTNEPNIKAIGSILENRGALDLANSESWSDGLNGNPQKIEVEADFISDDNNQQQRIKKMKEQIATLLKLDPNASDEVIVNAVRVLVEQKEEAEEKLEEKAEEVTALENRAATAEAKIKEHEAALQKAELDAKIKAELEKYPDLENREAAEGMLRADFEKGSAFLSSLKIAGKVPGKKPEDDLENREGKDKLFGLARVVANFKSKNQ